MDDNSNYSYAWPVALQLEWLMHDYAAYWWEIPSLVVPSGSNEWRGVYSGWSLLYWVSPAQISCTVSCANPDMIWVHCWKSGSDSLRYYQYHSSQLPSLHLCRIWDITFLSNSRTSCWYCNLRESYCFWIPMRQRTFRLTSRGRRLLLGEEAEEAIVMRYGRCDWVVDDVDLRANMYYIVRIGFIFFFFLVFHHNQSNQSESGE